MWKTSLAAIGFLLGQLVFYFALMTVHDLARAGVFPVVALDESVFLSVIPWGTLSCGLAGGIVGYRAGSRRDFRSLSSRIVRGGSFPTTESGPVVVPTFSLVAYLLTMWAWELEFAVLLIHIFTKKKLDPMGHGMLLAGSLSLTLFSWLRGKREFARLKASGGRSTITRHQACVIAAVVIGLGFFFGLVVMRLVEH